MKLDEDIPFVECKCNYKPEKFSWIIMFLMAFSLTLIGSLFGYTLGYVNGYVNGISNSIEMIQQVQENDETVEGQMPW